MAARKTPVYSRCLEKLRSLTHEADQTDGRFPTVRELSKSLEVSVFTISRALRQLQQEGELVIVHGCGAFTQSGVRKRGELKLRELERKPRLSWQDILHKIEHDMVTGAFPAHLPIPSVKELAARYNVSPPTVRRAMKRQNGKQENPLLPTAQAWQNVRVAHRSTLLLVTQATQDGRPVFVNERNHDFFWNLERECDRRGLSVALLALPPENLSRESMDGVVERVSTAARERPTAAIALVAAGFDAPDSLGAALAKIGPPLALVDELERISGLPVDKRRYPYCIIGFESSMIPGHKVGKALVELGHSNIAFFTDIPHGAMSAQRREGIEEILNQFCTKAQIAEFAVSLSKNKMDDSSLEQAVSVMAPKWAQKGAAFSAFARRANQFVAPFIAQETLRNELMPLFAQALRKKSISAWVTLHDPVAFVALDFLRDAKVPVPGQIAVISFDNYLKAQGCGLSSYDFGFVQAVQTIVSFACNPHAPYFRKLTEPVAIEGTLVRRESSG